MTTPTIEFRDVHKSFDNNEVLRGVSLSVSPGSIHYVLGQSGAGKSLLIKHVVGLVRCDQGEVLFAGQQVNGLSEAEFMNIRRRCQLIFQNSTLFEDLSVLDNIALPMRHRFNLSSAQATARADGLLKRLKLAHLASALAGTLGAGVQKRIATARAVGMQPEVLLYDEPTTGLDPVAARRNDRLVRELQREGLTQLVVSHDMQSARAAAERISFLHAGRVYFDGPAATFWERLGDPVLQAFVAPPPVLAPLL